jgi:hypothetical protein
LPRLARLGGAAGLRLLASSGNPAWFRGGPWAAATGEQQVVPWRPVGCSDGGQEEEEMMNTPFGRTSCRLTICAMTSQEAGKMCEKKQVIFDKFNALLKKLGYENVVRNETDQKAYDAKMNALRAWLDGESTYRLEVEKEKEAAEGAAFARAQYEKWEATVKATKERLDTMNAKYPKEKEDIALERELIKTIMRLVGIMEDQPLDEASKAAGGYMAAKKADAQALKELKAKVAELKLQAAKGGAIQLRQVNILQQKLASFAESDAVKDLLMGMLRDLQTREDVIDKSLADTKAQLEAHQNRLMQYEQEVVDLSNAADKAKQKADAKDLQRHKLDGDKINSAEEYDNEHAEFQIVAPPAERSVFIIQVIMDKIEKFCSGDKTDAVVGAGVSMPGK